MMTAPAYRAHPIKNFFRNEGNRWRRHPASALLRLLCRLSVLITIFALLAIVIDLLVKGIPHLTPELFSLKYTTENQSMLPAIINTLLIALVVCLIFKAQMKTARKATGARNYLVDGTFQHTESRDDYIRTTRSTEKIERNDSGSSSSSGGSSVDSDGFGGSSGGKF